MKKRVSKYNVSLVRESAKCYEIDTQIKRPSTYVDLFKKVYNVDTFCEEHLLLACLDVKSKVIGTFEVSTGTINASILHPREVFKRALLLNSASIIIAHNHPSGDPRPSDDDIEITKRLLEAGTIIGIRLVDHIIITSDSHYSLREQGDI